MKRYFVIFSMLIFVIAAKAQNEIDRMVNKFNVAGDCTFTSAVERDPSTRKIKKTVKVFEAENSLTADFVAAFRRLSDTGSFKERHEDGVQTMILTVSEKTNNRIYMLRAPENKAPGKIKVTIIVKIKN